MYGVSSNSNKENSSAMEIPEDAAALPGQTQGGRGVQQQQVVVQLSDQIKTELIVPRQARKRCAPESVHVLTDESPLIPPDKLRRIKRDNKIAEIRENLVCQVEELCQETTGMLRNLAEQRRPEAECAAKHIAEKINIIKSRLSGIDTQCKFESAEDFEREFRAVSEYLQRSAGMSEEAPTSYDDALPLCLVIIRTAKKHIGDLLDTTIMIGKSEAPERSDDSDDDLTSEIERDIAISLRESGQFPFLSKSRIDEEKYKKGNELEATGEFQRAVLKSLERLELNTRIWTRDDIWPLCQAVIAECKALSKGNNDKRSYCANLAFMRMIMSPVYAIALGKLFEGLQQQVNEKSSWECSEARIDGFNLDVLEGRVMCDYLTLRNKIVGQFIRNELNYMASLVDFPLEFAVDRISYIIARIQMLPKLLDYLGPSYDAEAIRCQEHTVNQKIARKMKKWSDDSRKKSFDELEKMVLNGTANEDNKRQYTDFLSWRFVQMVQANGGVCLDAQGSARLLGKLAEFHAQHANISIHPTHWYCARIWK